LSLDEERLEPELARDLDDDVGGQPRDTRGLADRFVAFGLVESIGLALVGGGERVESRDPRFAVHFAERLDVGCTGIDGLGLVSLDEK
jgi:hypothetical protein